MKQFHRAGGVGIMQQIRLPSGLRGRVTGGDDRICPLDPQQKRHCDDDHLWSDGR